jgi:hypothetical protein
MTVVELAAYRRLMRAVRLDDVWPAVAEILESLAASGGAAHRSEVIKRIAERRGLRAGPGRQDLEAELLTAFDRYLVFAATRRPPPLMHLPFGPGSYRWALTEAGRQLIGPAEAPSSQSARR